MFAKLAQHRAIDRRYVVSAPIASTPANSNKIDWRLAAPARQRRPTLACRWQLNRATGRLECCWAIDDAEAATQEPEPSGSIIALRPLVGLHPGKRTMPPNPPGIPLKVSA